MLRALLSSASTRRNSDLDGDALITVRNLDIVNPVVVTPDVNAVRSTDVATCGSMLVTILCLAVECTIPRIAML